MRKKDVFAILFPVVIVVLLHLVSCATPPPTKELADAEAAVAAATNQCSMCKGDWCQNVGKPDVEYCGYPCGDAELAAAQAALAKGKVLAGEFCHELEARRMLVDAKAKADEARFKCLAKKEAPPPPPMVEEEFGLKDIFFDFDKYDIRPDAEPVLQENADVLKNNPNVTMVIEGYADIRGTPAYNLRLAQRRADAAKAYLVRQGVGPSRITTASGGETTQFAAGTSEDSFQLNRRAHFIPTQPSASAPGARIYFKFNDESKPAL
ncbi:MAG: peptidoglycan-associated lipoprotein, peptidoglycan-associated lipoprotein [Candidatus Dadabacteria bacterium CSP1-2]|nr:MAG: peptidoglycan-associated lipoprotein, peptidoglycan-associated lipoprotein [Candidatus Dadabacteria bacterium CSP1-2]